MDTGPASDSDGDLAPRVVNAQTAGRLLGVSRTTLWDLSRRGELPCLHIGRSVRWAVTDIDAFIARMRSEAWPPATRARRRPLVGRGAAIVPAGRRPGAATDQGLKQ
jgi:excisionase family DNA binding protein